MSLKQLDTISTVNPMKPTQRSLFSAQTMPMTDCSGSSLSSENSLANKWRLPFGSSWMRQRIPGDMRSKWHEKQSQDTGAQHWPTIAYADFTDYVTIITRNDNWRDLFAAIFDNKISVQESFRRLYPIRLATMHARTITQDDELYLYVETKRILAAIGITA